MKTVRFWGMIPIGWLLLSVAFHSPAFPAPAEGQFSLEMGIRAPRVPASGRLKQLRPPAKRHRPALAGYSSRIVVPGVRYVFFRFTDHGPLNVHLLEVDLNRPNIHLELSHYHHQNQQATVSRLASHRGVVAAINGSFFQFMAGSVATPVGIVMINGRVLYDSRHRRTSFGINSDNEVVIGIPRLTTIAVAPDLNKVVPIDGVNTRRGYHQAILYTTHFNDRTVTNRWGRDVIVRGKKVIGYTMGNAAIPRDGYVLSFHGMGREVLKFLPPGTHMEVTTIPEEPRWDNLKFLITGGPHLVHRGRLYNTYFQEKFRRGVMYPNARSAIGITAQGQLLLATINPGYRGGGITLSRLARLLVKLGAVEALNLDGGGSATLYVGGRVVNRTFWNRPVNNALLIYAD